MSFYNIESILYFYQYIAQPSDGKTCTSSRFECAFNLTKGPRVLFSELSGAKPYNKICRYEGRLYQLGWTIAIAGDPCMSCLCDERWDDRNPLESLSCSRIDCEPDLQIKLKAGCLPLYSSTECCPIDYYCRKSFCFDWNRLLCQNFSFNQLLNWFKDIWYFILQNNFSKFHRLNYPVQRLCFKN